MRIGTTNLPRFAATINSQNRGTVQVFCTYQFLREVNLIEQGYLIWGQVISFAIL